MRGKQGVYTLRLIYAKLKALDLSPFIFYAASSIFLEISVAYILEYCSRCKWVITMCGFSFVNVLIDQVGKCE